MRRVSSAEGSATQEDAKVVAIGGVHGARRIPGGEHGFLNEAAKTVEVCG